MKIKKVRNISIIWMRFDITKFENFFWFAPVFTFRYIRLEINIMNR